MGNDVLNTRKIRVTDVARDKCGASFIIALVFLLVCVMVTTVVITSSSVSVERSQVSTEEQQSYYAVSSGIELARELCTTKGPIADLKLSYSGSSGLLEVKGSTDDSELAQWAIDAANAIAANKSASDYTTSIAAFSEGNVDVPEVKLTFTMNSSYKITITSELADSSSYDVRLTTTVAPSKLSGSYPVSWKES
ncbi:MAG: hypothetical protein ACOX69_02085 [Coriobacteriales bacterium]|jgi:hypothetical protein